MLILAASKSDSEASNDKNALRLHCCCVIVQISPAQQKLNVGAKVSGSHTGKAASNRKPVCICNAQYRWQQELLLKKAGAPDQPASATEATERQKQTKKEESASALGQDGSRTVGAHLAFINQCNDDQSPLLLSKKHGSLDRLLQLSQISSNGHAYSAGAVVNVATLQKDPAKLPRVRHEKFDRKVKSTESALPPSFSSGLPTSVSEKLQGPLQADRNNKMDANQLQQLQYLQRGPYPIPQQQQQQSQHQAVLQPVTANQQELVQNVNDEYNRKLFHIQQQQKRLESVQSCQQSLANNTAPITSSNQRRHHHHANQHLPQFSAASRPSVATAGNNNAPVTSMGGAAKQHSSADAKEKLHGAIFQKQAVGPDMAHLLGDTTAATAGGERREKKIIWSNHVHHKSSANGSTPMTQNFQLKKNPSYPSLQQYYIHPQKATTTNEVCNRNYQQQASSAAVIDNNGREWFDRSQRQRQSSRSVGEAENIIYQTIGAPPQGQTSNIVTAGSNGAAVGGGLGFGHQRHSSGPSEISLLKDDFAKLLSQLSLDAMKKKGPRGYNNSSGCSGEARGRSVDFVVKDDSSLGQTLQKRPVQRQTSGPSDMTAIRSDLIEWLTRQKPTINLTGGDGGAKQIVNKEDLYAKVVKPSLNTGISSATAPHGQGIDLVAEHPVPKPRKRHSFGHEGEQSSERSRKQSPQTAIQKFEIPKEMMAQLELNSSFVDLQLLRRPSKSTSHIEGSKVLRHSASEVVTSSTGNNKHFSTNNGHKQHSSRSSSKSKRHHTQRSATVSEMVLPSSSSAGRQSSSGDRGVRNSKKQSGPRRSSSSISSLPKCTDPNCPFLPICTDPDCCYLANCYDRVRYTQHIPRCRCKKCTPNRSCSDYRCNSLPRCMDSKCPATSGSSAPSLIKCNSLPRCAESSSSSFIHNNYLQDNCAEFPLVPQNNSQRRYNGSRSSLSQEHCSSSGGRSLSNGHTTMGRHHHHRSANKTENGAGFASNSNGKLVKSVSAASLNSRRRRHKTVHFGDNLLREVCQNRKFMQSEYVNVPTTTTTVAESGNGVNSKTTLQPNIEMLYNFIEGVLSSWVDDDYDDIDEDTIGRGSTLSRWTGAESDPERGGVLKPLHRCNRARIQTIRRVVGEAAQLKGSAKLGNQRYRHRHWRGTAKDCNERFLRKVIIFPWLPYLFIIQQESSNLADRHSTHWNMASTTKWT